MSKKVFLTLLCCVGLWGGPSSDVVDELKNNHKNVNDTHKAHKREFENIKNILKKILLSQANLIFEMYKEADLLFISIQAEGEGELMTREIPKELFK